MAEQLFNFGGSGGGTSIPGMGSNQYMNFPTVGGGYGGGLLPMLSSSTSMPGIVPQQGGPQGQNAPGAIGQPNTNYAPAVNSQYYVGMPQDPALSYDFFNYLQSQIGKGVSPFNLSAIMGSSGMTTAPGQLTAPDNKLLMELFGGMTGGTGPFGNLQSMIATGNPIDQTPAWQAMVQSMQQNISENQANLKEQFNVGGGLIGSPYGHSMADFMEQTSKDENAMLLGAQTSALESAANRQLEGTQLASGLGQYMQGLDQSGIDRLYQEFIRTSPQYNPLLQYMMGASTTYPPYMPKNSGMGALGGILGGAGAGMAGLAQLIPVIAGL